MFSMFVWLSEYQSSNDVCVFAWVSLCVLLLLLCDSLYTVFSSGIAPCSCTRSQPLNHPITSPTNQSINQSINQSDYQLLRVCSSGKEIRPVANDPFVAASEEAASLPPCHRNHPLAAAPGGGKGDHAHPPPYTKRLDSLGPKRERSDRETWTSLGPDMTA